MYELQPAEMRSEAVKVIHQLPSVRDLLRWVRTYAADPTDSCSAPNEIRRTRAPALARLQQARELTDAQPRPSRLSSAPGDPAWRVVMSARVQRSGRRGRCPGGRSRRSVSVAAIIPPTTRQTRFGGAVFHPGPCVLMRHVQGGHRADRRGCTRGTCRRPAGVAPGYRRCPPSGDTPARLPSAVDTSPRGDVAAQVDDGPPAQMSEVVPLVVGRRHRREIRRCATRRWCPALLKSEHVGTTATCRRSAPPAALPKRFAPRIPMRVPPNIGAGVAGLADDGIRRLALAWRAGQPHADVAGQHSMSRGASDRG